MPLIFYVNSNLSKFKECKKIILGNCKKFWILILVNWAIPQIPNLTRFKGESRWKCKTSYFKRFWSIVSWIKVLWNGIEIVSDPKPTQTPLTIVTSALYEKASNAEYSDISLDYFLVKTDRYASMWIKKDKKSKKP